MRKSKRDHELNMIQAQLSLKNAEICLKEMDVKIEEAKALSWQGQAVIAQSKVDEIHAQTGLVKAQTRLIEVQNKIPVEVNKKNEKLVVLDKIDDRYYNATYANYSVAFDSEKNFINATHLCKALGVKKSGDFFRGAKNYDRVEKLASELSVSIDDLLDEVTTPRELCGRYCHLEIADLIILWRS